MIKIKKMICILLTAIICLSFGACQPANSDTGPVEKGATAIMIFAREFEGWRIDQFNSLVRSINEDLTDGIQVEVEYIIENNFNDRLAAARASGSAPDIIMYSYNHIFTQAIDQKTIVDLSDYISQDALNDIDDVVKSCIEFDSKTYAGYCYAVGNSSACKKHR